MDWFEFGCTLLVAVLVLALIFGIPYIMFRTEIDAARKVYAERKAKELAEQKRRDDELDGVDDPHEPQP